MFNGNCLLQNVFDEVTFTSSLNTNGYTKTEVKILQLNWLHTGGFFS
jgi:hypothetical protein